MAREKYSAVGSVCDALLPMVKAIVESQRVQSQLRVRTWAETTTAIENGGYEVWAVDFSLLVSGAAICIGDDRIIAVNRAQSDRRQRYTAVHELAHHAMHLGPLNEAAAANLAPSMKELQADLFASSWVQRTATDAERTAIVEENPESRCLGPVILIAALTVAVAAVIDLLTPRSPSPSAV